MGNESEAKEPIQMATQATVDHLGRIASIVATAVRDIATEISKWVDDIASTRGAAQQSSAEEKPAGEKPPVADTD